MTYTFDFANAQLKATIRIDPDECMAYITRLEREVGMLQETDGCLRTQIEKLKARLFDLGQVP